MLKITAVSYLNTFPFVYGLKTSRILDNFHLDLQVPSICARQIIENKTDIALVPAGALPEIRNYHILSDFCIGATGTVKTVLLLSRVPLEQIKAIHLDFDSRTSVKLVQILAGQYWNIKPGWIPLSAGAEAFSLQPESIVAIGDKTFQLRRRYPYVYDLAEEWIRFTSLPFVFAVWITRKLTDPQIADQLNRSLAYGVARKQETIAFFRDVLPECDDCLGYLEHNISYPFDEAKRQGLGKFLSLLDPSRNSGKFSPASLQP